MAVLYRVGARAVRLLRQYQLPDFYDLLADTAARRVDGTVRLADEPNRNEQFVAEIGEPALRFLPRLYVECLVSSRFLSTPSARIFPEHSPLTNAVRRRQDKLTIYYRATAKREALIVPLEGLYSSLES